MTLDMRGRCAVRGEEISSDVEDRPLEMVSVVGVPEARLPALRYQGWNMPDCLGNAIVHS